MTTFGSDGLVVDEIIEQNDTITVLLKPKPGSFAPGKRVSTFEAFTGFAEDAETGKMQPVFEPVILEFDGY